MIPNPFGGTEPRMTSSELDNLVGCIICNPRVRVAAMRFLEPGHFTASPSERCYQVVLSALFELVQTSHPEGKAIRSELNDKVFYRLVGPRTWDLGDGVDVVAKWHREVFARPQFVDGKEIDRLELLRHVRSILQLEEVDSTLGFNLLRRFLFERAVFDQIEKMIMDHFDQVPSDLGVRLSKWSDTWQRIGKLGAKSARPNRREKESEGLRN